MKKYLNIFLLSLFSGLFLAVGCSKSNSSQDDPPGPSPDPEKEAPTVVTASVTSVTVNSASCGGNVTSDGGATVTARGVVWNTSENPTLESCVGKTSDGDGTGAFSSSITGLTASTAYYVRAYATNSAGTSYGEQQMFKTEDIATPDYFCITILESNADITFEMMFTSAAKGIALQYSTDGSTWQDLIAWQGKANPGTTVHLSNAGDKMFVKAKTTNNTLHGHHFMSTKNFEASGDIMYLLNGGKPATFLSQENERAFEDLFSSSSKIVSAEKLKLPAMELSARCYKGMFSHCRLLVKAPALPAVTLAEACYSGMFFFCTALPEAPVLPALTLVDRCYSALFAGDSCLSSVTMLANQNVCGKTLDLWMDAGTGSKASSRTLTVASGMSSDTAILANTPNDWTIVEQP